MTPCSAFQQVPVVLVDLPTSFHELLRAIGIPAVRRQQGNRDNQTADAQFVLYSSRTIDGQIRRQLNLESGHQTIDVDTLTPAGLVERVSDSLFAPRIVRRNQPDRLVELTHELKSAWEKRGLAWIRLADFPYPYRGAVCFGRRDELAHHTELLPAIDDIPGLADQQRYRLGLPVFSDASPPAPIRRGSSAIPGSLLWKTSTADLSEWWSWRKQLQWELSRRDSQYEVRVTQDASRFVPQLEIWRGSFVATIPVNGSTATFVTDRLPLQRETVRHPSGLISAGRLCQPMIASSSETTSQAA